MSALTGLLTLGAFCLAGTPNACSLRTTPQEASSKAAITDYRKMAVSAVDDLLRHFWVGSEASGHALDTYNGYARKDDPRGILWERATFIAVLANLHQVTKDKGIRRRIASDWAHVSDQIRPSELQSCGKGSHNVGQDDAGWSSMMYLNVYRATGDSDALHYSQGLFNQAYSRWTDNQLGGGMWYNDDRKFKSSYQAALILVGIRLHELTKNQIFRDRAIAMYEWVEKNLLRPDGLYWCEYWPSGPQSVGGINEALSVSFLGGNIAMGVVHARLFRNKGREVYKERALRTAEAILAHETDGKGHYLDDRDAWANGYFMGEWAREVLTLPGVKSDHLDLLRRTAMAVYERSRTQNGYYGGCWGGPAEGDACPWYKAGAKPEQIMTSSSAVNVIVAAAALDNSRP